MTRFSITKGFTLIELLVVIAIIAILATTVIATLGAARAKNRDAVRYSDMIQLRTAINRYFTENGSYPNTGNVWYSSEAGDVFGNNSGNWIPGLVAAKMIPGLPGDPLPGLSTNPNCTAAGYKRDFLYKSDATGTHFKLLANCSLEGNYPAATNQWYDVTRPTWAIQTTDNATVTSAW